jgi:hypothetical protein
MDAVLPSSFSLDRLSGEITTMNVFGDESKVAKLEPTWLPKDDAELQAYESRVAKGELARYIPAMIREEHELSYDARYLRVGYEFSYHEAKDGEDEYLLAESKLVDAISLDEAKQLKRSEIKAHAESECKNLPGGLEVEGIGRVNGGTDALPGLNSQILIAESKMQLGQASRTDKLSYRMYDNSDKLLTYDELLKIRLAILEANNRVMKKKWSCDDAIANSESVVEVSRLHW